MRTKSIILALGMTLLLAACAKPRIDTSSDEAMKKSIATVRESLPEKDREKFDESLKIVAFSQMDFSTLVAAGSSGMNLTETKVKQVLAGKTAEEIIAAADRIVTERQQKERAQALNEIKELEEKQTQAQRAKIELAKFQVIRSRFYKVKEMFLGDQPVIELSVKNGTDYPVSRAYFVGTLASPGRAVPWLKEEFNYPISGGLEPGESANWRLSPSMFAGEWSRVEAPKDAILTVEVVELAGADGKSLFSSRAFTPDDAERLTELKKKYVP
ncbi:MAG TPA: hypothetical protein PKG76_15865 [Acidobacteriota bacterium]|nr:hypothetical protein [Acidobacteriota bacterium]